MRHMYDRDGNIPYAGKVRVSRRWQGSRTSYRNPRTKNPTRKSQAEMEAAIVELDTRTHQERIRDILNSSKWSSPQANFNG